MLATALEEKQQQVSMRVVKDWVEKGPAGELTLMVLRIPVHHNIIARKVVPELGATQQYFMVLPDSLGSDVGRAE